jgi:hypothetical protein
MFSEMQAEKAIAFEQKKFRILDAPRLKSYMTEGIMP